MTNDVVDTLLDVREGDRLDLEAEQYDFKSAYEVAAIDEQSWRAPGDRVWRSRRVTLVGNTDGPGPRSERDLDVYPNAPAPEWSSYGQLTAVEPVEDGEDDTDDTDCPDWLERPADEIVDGSPIPRSLPEVLEAVEANDTLIDINTRVAATSISATRELLWQLGLRGQDGRLLDDDVLEDRIEEMREVFC